MSPIYVKSSATGEGLPSLDTVEKALDEMQELLKQAQDIAIKTPYIENGTWWCWNASLNKYIDTLVQSQGEKGQDGLNGRDGIDGKDGISPTISIAENTSNSYILTINDTNGSFNTSNLKGPSGSGTDITVDTELSETSENPLQNKAIAKNLSTIQAEIVKLNDLIKNLPSGETSVTTLFSNSNHEEYLDKFKFKDNQWGDDEFTFQQAIEKVNSLCSKDYNYQLRISSMFG